MQAAALLMVLGAQAVWLSAGTCALYAMHQQAQKFHMQFDRMVLSTRLACTSLAT